MEHIKYNGYAEEFWFICREGKKMVMGPCDFSKRKEIKMVDAFFKDLEEHGYDVIKPIDGEEFEKAVGIINECSRLWSIALALKTYTKYILDGEINRCGKWFFATSGRCKCDFYSVELKQGRGGRRKGAGRKTCASMLIYDKTTTIRVPYVFKDNFKRMSDFFIERASSGVNMPRVLLIASFFLKRMAELCREDEYQPDIKNEWAKECDQAREVIDELSKLIPSVALKEEIRKNENVTETNE